MIYRFIDNIGDFFTPGYYTDDFMDKVISMYINSIDTLEDTEDGDRDSKSAIIRSINSRFSGLKAKYYAFKNLVIENKLHKKHIIKETHEFNSEVMAALGYDTTPAYSSWIHIDSHSVVPARSVLVNGDKTRLVIMEMQPMIKCSEDDQPAGLFEQQYNDDEVTKEQKYFYPHWSEVIQKPLPEGCKISPSKINEAVSAIFNLPEQRPQYILILAGNVIMLIEQDKWDHGAYLKFDLEELFSEASIAKFKDYYTLFYLLTAKEVLAGDAHLMEQISEESFKNAYEVTKDLKNGVIRAVELLANEAIHYKKNVLGLEFDETDDSFEAKVKDDCLTIIYRLLFIFYAEARPEIGILPMNDEIYAKGYSLDILRDLEQTPLKSDQERNSYFFNDSLWTLFRLICEGHHDADNQFVSFSVRKIDSPLFDDSQLKVLQGVRFRNCIWQEIICSLSLSEEQSRKSRGRISYANLGINQLGSVYESLLAYRGFYAEEDYIEVHKANDPKDGTFLVPRSRMGDFHDNEILKKPNGEMVVLEKGQFVYRLNGRDRKKSASYYTPEILTKSTVKYTLKGFVDRLESGEMEAKELLKLKILEPAMGAAAFQNEVINQVAELYLKYRQKETGKRIAPHKYRDELQKVKAYIATKNIYGVDLNPTAIELGKLSLWLNVIHKDMETPFFGHRIALGNAVIGAWFKAYDESELCKTERTKYVNTEWWTKSPHLLHFSKERKKIIRKVNEIYHFLLPDKNMLGVLKISEQKAANPEKAKKMAAILKEWTKPITKEETVILRRLSQGIDKLISDYIQYQEKVEKLTANNYEVWEHRSYQNFAISHFNDKQALVDSRNARNNAFYKLKTIMDYWCSLWFWEYEDSALLPEDRMNYWLDIQGIIGLNMSSTPQSKPEESKEVLPDLFATEEDNTEEEEVVYTRQDADDIMSKYKSRATLLDEVEENFRIPIVQKLAERYHFFHPMLEFIEVFWLRDGFDVIVGNPPWLKLEFDEKDIISEKFPEVSIRKVTPIQIKNTKLGLLESNKFINHLYNSEIREITCSALFMNGYSNYPLLIGQQTNLYKCILENGFYLLSNSGYMGLLHPETIYDDPNGQPLRCVLYNRLKYHFQYTNELQLFAEIDHHTKYGCHIYESEKTIPAFKSIHNLFHPSTIDGCFVHDGSGLCPGLKENGRWCTASHKDRVVDISEEELRVLATTFEDDADWHSAKLVSIHAKGIFHILKNFSGFPNHIRDLKRIIRVGWDEANAVKAGTIIPQIYMPAPMTKEVILSGPHFFVANPCYKTPYKNYKSNGDYSVFDLTKPDSYFIRTLYKPGISINEFSSLISGFDNNLSIGSDWFDYYKIAFRKMLGPAAERTLIGAIIPPKHSHVGGVISLTVENYDDLLEISALTSSVVLDFYMKTIGSQNLYESRLSSFPCGVDKKYHAALFSRILRLTCLNEHYADLWRNTWKDNYSNEAWSLDDTRLSAYENLSAEFKLNNALRTYYERRYALIELDVISAMALGLSRSDLEMIYRIQFPVMQQYESDTWYDQKGNIVFTCSKGLTGVGLDRKQWEQIRNQKEDETYVHTIDPAKSELYGGQQVTYYAPYTKCDRIEDYRRAWAHFEKIFKEEE